MTKITRQNRFSKLELINYWQRRPLNGFIKLPRSLWTTSYWHTLKPIYREIGVTCLMLTNYKDEVFILREGGRVHIRRGQFITSLDHLSLIASYGLPAATDLGWFNHLKTNPKDRPITPSNVRYGLIALSKAGFLTKQATKQFTIITICDYGDYQGKLEFTQQGTPRSNTQKIATNEEHKNVNKNKLQSLLSESRVKLKKFPAEEGN